MSRRNSLSAMDVDSPASLKRSSSAPMINDLSTTMAQASTSMSTPRESTAFNIFDSSPRTRRFSASYNPLSGGGPRLTARVNQLKQEECIDIVGREAAHERELHSAMHISQSWEDLTLVTSSNKNCDGDVKKIPSRFTDPLQVTLPQGSPLCSSPSPTRSGLRPLPASLHNVYNMSPSPTRRAFQTRRSLSPIALRPSTFVPLKRKIELDDEREQNHLSPPMKRFNCSNFLTGQRLSPLGSLSNCSVGTPESLSSADSPGFFRPVDSPSPSQNVPSPHTDEPMTDLKQDTTMTLIESTTAS